MDLVKSRKDGNRIYYKANTHHPIYLDLVSILEKTVGIVSELKVRLDDPRIRCAFFLVLSPRILIITSILKTELKPLIGNIDDY